VLGTKPIDDEMDAYIAEGYTRIETWPPPRKALRPLSDGSVRLVLWPKIKTREQLRSHRPTFARCLDEVMIDVGRDPRTHKPGGWTVVADEGLWLMKRDGLALGEQLSAIAYAGRSSGITLMMLLQRPSGVPRDTWANAMHAFVWNHGVTTDTRELASLGTVNPKAVTAAVESLRGFQFLYLPCRAGTGWAVSQVQL
jgi:hypothetical protein